MLGLQNVEVMRAKQPKEEALDAMYRFLGDSQTCRREGILRAALPVQASFALPPGYECKCDICRQGRGEEKCEDVDVTAQVREAIERHDWTKQLKEAELAESFAKLIDWKVPTEDERRSMSLQLVCLLLRHGSLRRMSRNKTTVCVKGDLTGGGEASLARLGRVRLLRHTKTWHDQVLPGPLPAPSMLRSKDEFTVECIVEDKYCPTGCRKKHDHGRQYLVKWAGYGSEHNEWKSCKELGVACQEMLADYDMSHDDGDGGAAAGREQEPGTLWRVTPPIESVASELGPIYNRRWSFATRVMVHSLVQAKKLAWKDVSVEVAERLGNVDKQAAAQELQRLVDLGKGRSMPTYQDMQLQFSINAYHAKRSGAEAGAGARQEQPTFELEWPSPASREGSTTGYTKRFFVHYGSANLVFVKVCAAKPDKKGAGRKHSLKREQDVLRRLFEKGRCLELCGRRFVMLCCKPDKTPKPGNFTVVFRACVDSAEPGPFSPKPASRSLGRALLTPQVPESPAA